MTHPATKADTLAALESNARTIAEFFGALPSATFFAGDSDRWSPGHHVVHLTRACVSVGRALASGKLPPHSNGRSRTYAEVRDAATTSLGAAPKDRLLEMGRTVIVPPGASQAEVIEAFATASAALRAAAEPWSEAELDRHALAHPLMGELTALEMLMFFVVHERHHLKVVRAMVGEKR